MSEFINTIDVLGDDAVIDSIIQRTITEFKDNRVNKIGDHAFYGCSALTEVDIPNATTIEMESFRGCTSLTTLDLPNVRTIKNSFRGCSALEVADFRKLSTVSTYGFYDCTALKALVLRNTEQYATMEHFYALKNTPIAGGTGFVYVPQAMVDGYKNGNFPAAPAPNATNWTTYADQIRVLEDYTVDGTITGELDLTKI